MTKIAKLLKFNITLVLVSFSLNSSALEFKVLDPCSGTSLVDQNVSETFKNVGELSVAILENGANDFVGSELGINTMFGTPTGDDALEIISRRQMRSYGWCYSVDGVVPELYPSNFEIEESTKVIEWFFGYASYDSGVWLSQCEPLHLNPQPFICLN